MVRVPALVLALALALALALMLGLLRLVTSEETKPKMGWLQMVQHPVPRAILSHLQRIQQSFPQQTRWRRPNNQPVTQTQRAPALPKEPSEAGLYREGAVGLYLRMAAWRSTHTTEWSRQ